MDTTNSNDKGDLNDFDGKDARTQTDGKETLQSDGDRAINGQCPVCFNPVETEEHEHDVRGGWTTITELVDFCPICGWQGYPYYED